MAKEFNLLSWPKKPRSLPQFDLITIIAGIVLALLVTMVLFFYQEQQLKKATYRMSNLVANQKEIAVQKKKLNTQIKQKLKAQQILQTFKQNQIIKKEILGILIFLNNQQKNIKFKEIFLTQNILNITGKIAIISQLKNFIADLEKLGLTQKITIDKISGNTGALEFALTGILKNEINS